MIRTKLAYGAGEIIFNPYTVSYIIRDELDRTAITFTNGHSLEVTASLLKIKELIEDETKSLCQECTKGVQEG